MGRQLQPSIHYWLLASFCVLRQYLLSSDLYVSVSLPASPPYPSGSFDHILLDAPCSALGQRPQFVVKMKLKELQSYPRLQQKLFTTVSNVEFLWLVKNLSCWQLKQPLPICALMLATIIIIITFVLILLYLNLAHISFFSGSWVIKGRRCTCILHLYPDSTGKWTAGCMGPEIFSLFETRETGQ